MSIPITSMSASRFSTEVNCTRVRSDLLPVDLARARIGEHFARPAIDGARRTEHCFGRFGQYVAMDVDGEVLAARMRRPGKPTGDACIGRQATEQHLRGSRIYEAPDLRRIHAGKTHAIERPRLGREVFAGHRLRQS